MKSCPVCAYQNPDGVDFCLRCATQLTQTCPSCGHLVTPDSKFCSQCGVRLLEQQSCPSCSATLLPSSRFCSQCGTPVSSTPATLPDDAQPSTPPAFSPQQDNLLDQFQSLMPASLAEKINQAGSEVQGERREVTVLFLDIMDFTPLSKRVDNEEIYLIIDEAMRLLVQIVYRYEGTVDKFTGDGLMALFGTPVAHENDPERAVRAALEMQQALKPLQTRVRDLYHFNFQARIGINTGVVIAGNLGNDLHMEYTVIGDTVNLAARLEKAAAPGTILVSFDTYQRTRPVFRYQSLPPLELKGIADLVPAFRPQAVRKNPGNVRGLPGMQVPMIGRAGELDALHHAWGLVQKSQRNQIVLVTGEAGLGKSRLVAEFRRELDNATTNIYEGNCLAFARSKPFFVLASLLRDILQINELDPPAYQRETLCALLDQLKIPMQQALPYLLNILGLEQPDDELREQIQQLDASMLQRQTHVALRQVLLAQARSAPLILILEDLHWVDPASKELLIYLFQAISDVPILLILISRNFERRTTIRPLLAAAEKSPERFTDIQLQRLSSAEATQLLARILKQSDEDDKLQLLQQRIIQRAEGNPFYIEEIVRMLIDQKVLIRQHSHFELTTRVDESLAQLPGTLKSLILTRFDGLNEELRQILQKAATLGRSFPLSLLQALNRTDPELTSVYLHELKSRLFLIEEPFNREPGFTFHHALIQEAIYSTLLKRDLRSLHGEIAAVIEQGDYYTEDERTEALGYHYAHSNASQKAIPYLIAAAESASRRSAHETAMERYRRALVLMADYPQTSLDEYSRVRIGLGQTLKLKGEFDEASQVLIEAVDRLREAVRVSPQWVVNLIEALKELADVRQREGALAKAVAHLKAALDHWERLNPQEDLRLWYALLDRIAWVRFRQGQLDEATQLASKAARDLEQQEWTAPALLASLYNTLGGTYYQQGNTTNAITFVQNSLHLYDMLGYAWGKAVAYSNLGVLYYVQGMWAQAAESYRQADVIRQENGFIAERAVNLRNLGLLHIAMGNHEQARRDYETSLNISQHLGDSTGVGSCHIGLAYLAHIQTRLEDAASHIHDAQEVADALGEDHFLQLMLIQAQIHEQTGALLGAFELASQALEMARSSNLSEEEVDACRILGTFHARTGEYIKAEALLRQSLELGNQRHNPYRQGLALLELSRLYQSQARERRWNRSDLVHKAREAAGQAIEHFERLGARYDLQIAQALLRELHEDRPPAPTPVSLSPAKGAGATTSRMPESTGERYQATVLWLQVQAATSVKPAVHPDDDEKLLAAMSRLVAQVAAVAQALEGTIIRQQESICIVFGAPTPHEDDPERAVRAAWHLFQGLSPQPQTAALPLGVQAAISSGEVIAGNLQGQSTADVVMTGEPLRRADELAQRTPAGHIWVTPSVRDHTGRVFVYQDIPGEDAAEVIDLQQQANARQGDMGHSDRFIGREPILRSMIQLAQNLPSNEGGIIWLEGEAGIGKSRLMQEFASRVGQGNITIWSGACSSQTTRSSFSLFSELLGNTFNLFNTDLAEEKRIKIRQKLEHWSDDAAPEVSPHLLWLHSYVEMLCGVPPTGEEQKRLANLEPSEMRQQIFVAVRTLLKAVASLQPLVILLDDLHWIDPMSADLLLFLSNMVTSAPILFICSQRSGEEALPGALQKIKTLYPFYTLHLAIQPLNQTESRTLLSTLLHEQHLPEELAGTILEHSDGNPYFIEELARMLLEQNRLAGGQDTGQGAGQPKTDDLPIPTSLTALVRARINALSPALKKTLQYAAVIGQPCEASLLAALTGQADIDLLLRQLAKQGLLEYSAETGRWQFSHFLTEKIVYSTLLKIQRQILHLEVAQTLEIQWGQAAAEHAVELAYHFSAADEPQKAIAYHVSAAERAAAHYANEEALAHFKQATALLSSTLQVDEDIRWRTAIGLGDIYRFIGKYTEALGALKDTLPLVNLTVDQRAGIHRRMGETLQRQGKPEAALDAFAQALSILADHHEQPALLEWARTYHGIAWTYFSQGDLEKARRNCLCSLQHAQMAGSLREQASAENLLGGIYHSMGEWTLAMQHTSRALAIREEIGYTWGVAAIMSNLGILSIFAGDWDEAQRYFQKSLAHRREMGDMEGISIVHINLGKLASEQGDLDASEYHYREGLQIAEHLNSAYYTTNARVGLAKVQLMQGNLTTAQETVERCQIEAKTVHAQELLIESRCIQAEILLEQAHADKAEALARESAIMAREVGIPGLEAAAWRLAGTCQIYRGLFSEAHHSLQEARHALASVTDHLEQARLSVQLGKLYLAEGRASEAMAYLHSAQVVFSRLGAQYDLEQLAQIRGDIEATPGTGHR